MYFDSLQALIEMDGHGAFVWTAYLVAIAVIGAVLVSPLRRRRRILRQLAGEIRRTQGQDNARGGR